MNPARLQLTPTERRALLRNDLAAFIGLTFKVLNPETPYLSNWHIDLIASELEAVLQGETTRLIINIPPRNLKSISASVAFPAFALGRNPATEILCVSYGQELANKLALDTRRVMESAAFREIFPSTRIASDRTAVHDFETTRGGGRMATSTGGVLTGRGADIIIIDDPIKPDEALSESQREAVKVWFTNTLLSRLNQKETGAIVLIMQRVHEDDLAGYLLGSGNWKVVSLPAIAVDRERHLIRTPWGTTEHVREPGELLHPERESLKVLQEYRTALGEFTWSAQFQQAPVPLGGGMIKEAWWGTYEKAPQSFDLVIQSWDTANKATELSDYSVCTTWGFKGGTIYLLHVFRERLDYPDLKRAVVARRDQWKPHRVLIEDQASGTQLIQDLRSEGVYQVTGVTPKGDKVMRMHTQSAAIEAGKVLLPAQASWKADYLAELSAFPKGRHDDQADSTSQALEYLLNRRPMRITDEFLRSLETHSPRAFGGWVL
jgi:predicted phage terminase large subunit-like protein